MAIKSSGSHLKMYTILFCVFNSQGVGGYPKSFLKLYTDLYQPHKQNAFMVSMVLYIFKLLNINHYKALFGYHNFLPSGLFWLFFLPLNKVKIHSSNITRLFTVSKFQSFIPFSISAKMKYLLKHSFVFHILMA